MTSRQPGVRAAMTFVNADMGAGAPTSLRVAGDRICALGDAPQPHDCVIDLQGGRLLPGLINAHDHLQLNSLPSVDFHQHYDHVREWIACVDAFRRADPHFGASAAASRDERLLIGGLKNLLSGVTTVAHHDPPYPFLWSARYPVRVVADCGWSHSLYLDGEDQVLASFRRTPSGHPWIIHACEGIDAAAATEFERLDRLGCLRTNTLLVHGIALERPQRRRLAEAGAGLIWCPASNLRLFEKTAIVSELVSQQRVALGTDSRLSGSRDLLDELRVACQAADVSDQMLERMVTGVAASLLRVTDRGALRPGALADLLVLPGGASLSRTDRTAVRLVVIGGEPRYGEAELIEKTGSGSSWVEVHVDGSRKLLHAAIASQLDGMHVAESGLELSDRVWKAA